MLVSDDGSDCLSGDLCTALLTVFSTMPLLHTQACVRVQVETGDLLPMAH